MDKYKLVSLCKCIICDIAVKTSLRMVVLQWRFYGNGFKQVIGYQASQLICKQIQLTICKQLNG